MKHPELPDGQLIEVDDLSVPHYRAAGWVVTDAPPPAPRPHSDDTEAPPEGVASVPESAPQAPKARRAPKEAEK